MSSYATRRTMPAPTSDEINALPEHIRNWIMELEAQADPAGEPRRCRLAEDENKALRVALESKSKK